jgi:hypothetical protein
MMLVFVSYANRDNDLAALRRIERLVTAEVGRPYIDDLHNHDQVDRQAAVELALSTAESFVAVASPHYLRTTWTRMEFASALRRGIPVRALMADGSLVEQSAHQWPFRAQADEFRTTAALVGD